MILMSLISKNFLKLTASKAKAYRIYILQKSNETQNFQNLTLNNIYYMKNSQITTH